MRGYFSAPESKVIIQFPYVVLLISVLVGIIILRVEIGSNKINV